MEVDAPKHAPRTYVVCIRKICACCGYYDDKQKYLASETISVRVVSKVVLRARVHRWMRLDLFPSLTKALKPVGEIISDVSPMFRYGVR